MKNICCLLLISAISFSIIVPYALAVDIRAKGRAVTLFEYGQNYNLTRGNGRTGYNKNSDEFNASQRLRLQLDAIASESLSGTLFLEVGQIRWGQNSAGGALGADSTEVLKVKHAYIDWTVPSTTLKLRMGLQLISTPAHATDSWIYGADTAAITANWAINENVGLTFFWARPWNDNYTGSASDPDSRANYMDNMDMFGLSLPLTFDGIKVTPWVIGVAFGPNTYRSYNANTGFDDYYGRTTSYFEDGLLPLLYQNNQTYHKKLSSYSTAIWAGVGADITLWDPFRLAFDFYYGSVRQPDDERLKRAGWLAVLLMEYELDWGVPGLVAWYGSGDDDNLDNGSERLPFINRDENGGTFSNYAFHAGRPATQRDAVIGHNPNGTWGIGLRLRDMALPTPDFKHTLRVNLMGGTNDSNIVAKMDDRYGIHMTPNNVYTSGNMLGMENLYMTDKDYALEIGWRSDYKIYENLTIGFDFAYITAWLDKDVWGKSRMNGKDDTVADSWNASFIFIYNF